MPRYSVIEHLSPAPTNNPSDSLPVTPITYPAIAYLTDSLSTIAKLSIGAITAATAAASMTPDQNSAILSAIATAFAYDIGYDSNAITLMASAAVREFGGLTMQSFTTNYQRISSLISVYLVQDSNVSPVLVIIPISITGMTMSMLLSPDIGIVQASSMYTDQLVSGIMTSLYCIRPVLVESATVSGLPVPPTPTFILNYISTYNSNPSNPQNICPLKSPSAFFPPSGPPSMPNVPPLLSPSIPDMPPSMPSMPPSIPPSIPGMPASVPSKSPSGSVLPPLGGLTVAPSPAQVLIPCTSSYTTPSSSDASNNTIFLTGPNCAKGGSSVTIIPGGTILTQVGPGKNYNSAIWTYNNGTTSDVSTNPSNANTFTLPNTNSTYSVKYTVKNTATGAYMWTALNISITADSSLPVSTAPAPPSSSEKSAFITKNGIKVYADYIIVGTFANYYSAYTGYSGGTSKFNTDLVSEIAAALKISESRLSVISANQVNGNDLSINILINNVIPYMNAQKNDQLSALCVYNSLISYINNTTPGTCSTLLPSNYTNVDDIYITEKFMEHALLSSISNVSGNATVPTVAVSKADDPSGIFDFIFMYAFLFAFLGSIFYSVIGVLNINPAEVIVNKNVAFALNMYIGVCGFCSLFYWYQTQIPFNTFFNPNAIKSKLN